MELQNSEEEVSGSTSRVSAEASDQCQPSCSNLLSQRPASLLHGALKEGVISQNSIHANNNLSHGRPFLLACGSVHGDVCLDILALMETWSKPHNAVSALS